MPEQQTLVLEKAITPWEALTGTRLQQNSAQGTAEWKAVISSGEIQIAPRAWISKPS